MQVQPYLAQDGWQANFVRCSVAQEAWNSHARLMPGVALVCRSDTVDEVAQPYAVPAEAWHEELAEPSRRRRERTAVPDFANGVRRCVQQDEVGRFWAYEVTGPCRPMPSYAASSLSTVIGSDRMRLPVAW